MTAAPLSPCIMTLFLNANCLDLLVSIALGLEGGRTHLDPGSLCRLGLNDFALLRRLLLNDVVVRARRRQQQRNGSSGKGQFLQHCVSSSGMHNASIRYLAVRSNRELSVAAIRSTGTPLQKFCS